MKPYQLCVKDSIFETFLFPEKTENFNYIGTQQVNHSVLKASIILTTYLELSFLDFLQVRFLRVSSECQHTEEKRLAKFRILFNLIIRYN